jgi:hypothetical protein
MSIIDRILNGEFDDKDNVNLLAPQTSSQCESAETSASAHLPHYDEDEDEEIATDEDEEFDDTSSEEVGDEDEEFYDDDEESMQDYSDIPSDKWLREKALEEDISESKPVPNTSTQYIEKPKQSKVRKTKKTMTNKINETPANNSPKQSVAQSAERITKRRGAPHKLTEHGEEVCRLYREGVGAKPIAEKFSVSVSCIINLLKRNNVTIRPKGRRKTND